MRTAETRRPKITGSVLGLVAGVVALGLFVASSLSDGGRPTRAATAFDSIVPARVDRDTIDVEADTSSAPATPAATLEAAVRAFLEAEIRGDGAASFAVLDSASREARGPLEAWLAGTAERPRYTGFEVTSVDDERVVTTVHLRPQLDETVGLVPAVATIEWAATAEDGGWLLDLGSSDVEPAYPDDAAAAPAAIAWARARQACERTGEYTGSLLLSPTLADSLCGTTASVTPGATTTLDALDDVGPVVAAFGDDAVDWARVVEVRGPADLAVVMAPLGDTWVVVGVASG